MTLGEQKADDQAPRPAQVEPVKLAARATANSRPAYKHREGAFSAPWIISSFITVNHILAVYCILFYRHVSWNLILFSFFYGWLQELGITAGYHRLWSHRSFSARLPLRIFLAFLGSVAFQGSIKWWVLRHRVHHRFTDTDVDPYNSTRGFWYAHIGWLFEKPRNYRKMSGVDISDLYADPVVRYQLKYIGHLYFWFGLVAPPLLGHLLLNDWLAGLLYIGVIPRILSWNGIWCTNSLSHMWGDRPYDDAITARGSLLAAIICNGEGNHNYHHAFPHDYRHGVKWYEWDPTKWCIWLWRAMGLVGDLKTASDDNVLASELRVRENRARELYDKAKEARARHGWPVERDLPIMSDADITRQLEAGRLIIKFEGFVLDVTEFASEHPGGAKVFLARKGKDATDGYNEFNMHTIAARELSHLFRIGRCA